MGTSSSDVKFHYRYDEFGDLIQRQDLVNGLATASLNRTYNHNHQLTGLIQSGAGLITQTVGFGYDKLSQLTGVDRQSGGSSGHLITDYQYDAVGRLSEIKNRFNTTVISHDVYSYDDGNRLTGKSGSDGNSTVGYGRDNQVSTVDNSIRADEAYSFNALGIRAGWVTDALDSRRVLSDGKYQYQYDDEGNLARKTEVATGSVTNYEWDYRNRLVKVISGAQIVEYGYDAEDKRVSKKINGVVKEKYVYDGADIALVVDAVGTLVERYLYGDGVDNVLSRCQLSTVNCQLTWSLGDKQGSVVDLVDEGGNVLNHFVYDSFGNRTAATGVDFRFGYTGRELDTETGLYYYRARYYDPTMGRFISEDPIGFGGGDTNLYRYVGNNSTNYTDPSGEIAFLPILGLLAMGAMNALIDVNIQLQVNKMTDKTDMNWASVGVSFGTGMLGFGLAQKATQTSSLAWKIAANPIAQRAVDSGIDGVGKIVENTINGKPLHNELFETVAGNFVLGGVADGFKFFGNKVLNRNGSKVITRMDELKSKHGFLHPIEVHDRINMRGALNEIADGIKGEYSQKYIPSNSLSVFYRANDRKLAKFARARAWLDSDEDYFNVFAHGSDKSITIDTSFDPVTMDYKELAKLIKSQKGYNGQSVKLYSCDTGKLSDGLAQDLATHMNVEVLAPTEVLWGYKNGLFKVSSTTTRIDPVTGKQRIVMTDPPDGSFKSFKP